ncbi:hypothetical protein GGI09_005101 [Coemansia sp. S100]|nr:hypothetical protein GGI09_005101 [Coemansia sp. S100]
MRYSRKQRGKETHMWRFRKIHEKVKKSFPIDAISKVKSWLAKFDWASLDPAKYKAYVEARAVVWPLLSGFYSKTLTKHPESKHKIHKHKIHKDKRHVVRSYPLHCKQRLSAYINQQQADYRLACNMRTAFGKDAIIMNEAAVMNFWRIVDSLCETGDIPQALKRSTPRLTCTAAGKRAVTTGRKAPSKRSHNGTS